MTITTTSALDTAREDLRQRLFAAEEAEDWAMRGILSSLYDVADMVCRIADHTDSTHYQASKAGPMVRSAIRARAAAMERHCEDLGDELQAAATLLIEVDRAVGNVLWSKMRPGSIYESDARALAAAIGELNRWAGQITASAVPDPVD